MRMFKRGAEGEVEGQVEEGEEGAYPEYDEEVINSITFIIIILTIRRRVIG